MLTGLGNFLKMWAANILTKKRKYLATYWAIVKLALLSKTSDATFGDLLWKIGLLLFQDLVTLGAIAKSTVQQC